MTLGPWLRAPRALLLAAALIAAAGPGFAQGPGPSSSAQGGGQSAPEVDPAQIESLIETLENDQARAELVAKLRALLEAQRRGEPAEEEKGLGARLVGGLSDQVETLSKGIAEASAVVLDVPRWLDMFGEALADPARRAFWIEAAWQLAAVIGAGLVAEWVVWLILRRPRAAVEGKARDGFLVRVVFLLLRAALDVLPIAAFAAAAYGAVPLLGPGPDTRVVALTLIYAVVLARAVVALFRMVLVPTATSLRLFAMGDETAAYLFVWAKRLTGVAVYGYFAAEAALLLGLPSGAHGLLLKLLGVLLLLLVVVFILQIRRSVAGWIRGAGEDGPKAGALRRRFGDVWHILAVIYAIAVFVVWAVGIEGGFVFLLRATALSVAVLIAALLAMRGVSRGTDRIFAISQDLRTRYPGLQERANRYLPLVQRAARFVIGAVALLALLQVWGLDALGWLGSEAGRGLLGSLVTIAAVTVGAVVLWELVSSSIERYLARSDSAPGRGQRLQTLLPLARKAISIAMVIFVALIVLSELGVDIAPLLAGAGVVGLAIGFGSQTLVKDIITGLFILLEDAVSVGDVAELGGNVGVVEAISLRTVQMRDLEGRVYTVPFSDVTTVVNYTKDYSFAFMEVGVAYRENVDEVIQVLENLAEEMRGEEDWGRRILEPLEVFGLDRFGDSAVIVRIRFRTTPGEQWAVRREYYRRMKARFDELGIEIPFPHVTLYMGADKAGEAPPLNLRQVRTPAEPSDAAVETKGKPRPPTQEGPTEAGGDEGQ